MLLRTINSSRSSSCYRMSLTRASRHMNNLWHDPAPISHQLQPRFLEEISLKVKLSYLHSEAPPIQMHSLDEHFSNSTHFYTLLNSFPYLMKKNTLYFVIGGSFYPERSSLISAAWRCSLEENLLVAGSFTSLVSL